MCGYEGDTEHDKIRTQSLLNLNSFKRVIHAAHIFVLPESPEGHESKKEKRNVFNG